MEATYKSIDGRTDKRHVRYTYNGLFRHKKEGNSGLHTAWMNFEDIMLSEISPSQKEKYCLNPLYEVLMVVRSTKTESRMVGVRDLRGQGNWMLLFNEYKVCFSRWKSSRK